MSFTQGIPYQPELHDQSPSAHIYNVKAHLDVRDRIDPEDLAHMGGATVTTKLAPMYMINKRPDRLDQGQLGSCTSNGTAYQYMIHLLNAGVDPLLVSRLQLYYDERNIEHDIPQDAGADPRDGLKTFNKNGVGDEKFWPYDIKKFTQTPPAEVYVDAAHHKIGPYYRVLTPHTVKTWLSRDKPIGVAGLVFEGWERSKNGVIPMPAPGEQPLGGHWYTYTGYCDRPDWPGGGYYRVDNTWGMGAGDGGCYYMPYALDAIPQVTQVRWRFTLPKAA